MADPAKVAEFRRALVALGSAKGAAREVGIPERTGVEWARAAELDMGFRAARALALNGAIESVELGLLRVVEAAVERVLAPATDEPRTDWAAVVVKAHHTLSQRVRATAETRPQTGNVTDEAAVGVLERIAHGLDKGRER